MRDASTTGALVFCRNKFALDEAVSLQIRIDASDERDVTVKGKIVRVERMLDGFWTFKLGISFNPEREDLATLFKSLAERQERLFGSST